MPDANDTPERPYVERQSGPPVTQSPNSGPMNVVHIIPPLVLPLSPPKVEVEEREDETVLTFRFNEEMRDM